MMPSSQKDDQAKKWFNKFLPKLQFGQDYQIYPGSSKQLFDESGKQTGISIKRPDIRLYSTGITKLYEMIVDGKELPDIEYTQEQNEKFYQDMVKKWPELLEDDGGVLGESQDE